MQKNHSSELTKVLVLDANQRSSLAVTRSLGKLANIKIITADASADALAAHSRHSDEYVQHPSINDTPQEFQEWLINFVKSHQIEWVFPVTEVSSQTILQLQDRLLPCQIPFAKLDTVMKLADKWSLVELAKSIGIPCPATKYFNNAAEVNVNDIAQYPIVVKPSLSKIYNGSTWINTAVHIASSEGALTKLLQDKDYLRDFPFMLQEFIPGHGAGVFALYDHGKPITFFAHRRLREKPPRGGVSTLSESAIPDPNLLAMVKELLDAAAWHGIAMVEFRVAADGTPYLMEVNTRFWGSLQLAIDSGVDFPALLYRVCCREHIEPTHEYTEGKRLRWLLGDIDSLYLALRDSNFTWPQKLRRLLDFVTPHPFKTRHEINRWNDLGPAWFELRTYCKDVFAK